MAAANIYIDLLSVQSYPTFKLACNFETITVYPLMSTSNNCFQPSYCYDRGNFGFILDGMNDENVKP